jgi:hypothetical protein
MQGHKTARMMQEHQSSESGALLGELQISVSARPASGGSGIWRMSAQESGTGLGGADAFEDVTVLSCQ